MTKARLETFSDGVVAIIITIMVLELKVPEGADWAAFRTLMPSLLTYALSFIYLGIYWVNHHHMLVMANRVDGRILWANLHLLFWLSLVPAGTEWLGENHDAPLPTAAYGFVLLMPAIAYFILQSTIIAKEGRGSALAAAVGRDVKGKISPLLYLLGIGLSFVQPWLADAVYVLVALMWLVPDPRIESHVVQHAEAANPAGGRPRKAGR
jgi:uncharacterized membrane protein